MLPKRKILVGGTILTPAGALQRRALIIEGTRIAEIADQPVGNSRGIYVSISRAVVSSQGSSMFMFTERLAQIRWTQRKGRSIVWAISSRDMA